MARTVIPKKLDTPKSRKELKRGRQPHWEEILKKPRAHLGYQRQPGAGAGRWLLRRYQGQGVSRNGKPVDKYTILSLEDAIADDVADANGQKILNHDQAKAKALAMIVAPGGGRILDITVRQAFDRYVEWKRDEGESVDDIISRGKVHILPTLGNLAVNQLTAELLRKWLATMAANAAQTRPKKGKAVYRRARADDDEAEQEEADRKRKASANRVLNMLKAILNKAYDDEQVTVRDAWGRRLKPFKNVDADHPRYLEIEQVQRLINVCEPDFRALVRAALETGARYGELARLRVSDFHSDSGTVTVRIQRKSKTGRSRDIVLTEPGVTFFRGHTAGRAGSELMFRHEDGSGWDKSEQQLPMAAALKNARIDPPFTFHGTRHTWASHALMNGVPTMVVSQNLGHKDTKMVERVYGYLIPSYKVEAIRQGGPRYEIVEPPIKVVTLR
jgi:integrase